MPLNAPSAEPAERPLLARYPAFRYFWLARGASALAYQMQGVAVGWQMYALTHSALNLGWVGFAQFAPMVLLTLPAGHAADHFNRRTICLLAVLAQAVGLAALGLGTWRGWISPAAIFTLVALIGAARAFERPASQALLPALVPAGSFPAAIAWTSTGFQAMSIAGPAVGGILYTVAPAPCYFVAAGLGALGAALLACIQHERPVHPPPPASLASLLSGVRYIRSNPVILGSISLDLFGVLLGGALALFPIFAYDILKVGARGLGVLRAAPSVGSLVMAAFLLRRPLRRRAGLKMFIAVLVFGSGTIVFGLSRNFFLSLAALVAIGAADMVSVVVRSSLVQLQTPDEMRGRVSAVNSLFIGTSNQLGEFESGLTAAWWGAVRATVAGGIGTIFVALAWMRLFPGLKGYDRLDARREKAGS